MGRHAQGWTLRLPEGRHIWLVRFQHAGRTVERSTGERDRGAATKRAAAIYAEVVSGRVAPRAASSDLVADMASWLVDYGLAHTAGTAATAEGYVRGFLAFFSGYARFTPSGYAEYMRERIGKVSRSTLRKELSSLRMFVAWAAVERGIMMPTVPGLPKRGHPGTRSKHARRREATILTPKEVERVLAAMSIRGPRSGAWLRPFFELMWETGLRPYSTIAKLEVPLHWRRGARGQLFISREIDKARYERTVPLTRRAQKVMESVASGESGLLFPHVDKDAMREALSAAARRAGLDKPISVYDFRHSRISHLANSGAPLAGVAFLVGHKHVSTTSLYVRASREAATAALRAAG
jgi:integrase